MYPSIENRYIPHPEQNAPLEFVETLCIEQGVALNLSLHNERMNRTRKNFWHDAAEELFLEDWIHPETYRERTRCRVVYAKEIKQVAYFPYQAREVRSLKLVTCDEADYTYKRTDRSLLNALFAKRGTADDILIVRKNLITDTSIANVALFDGEAWYTPKQPLLKGTQRRQLLEEGKLAERDILAGDLCRYRKIRLFNAMIPFGSIEFNTASIG